MIFLIGIVSFFSIMPITHQQKRKPLYFSYISSLTGKGFTASGGIPAVQLALDYQQKQQLITELHTEYVRHSRFTGQL